MLPHGRLFNVGLHAALAHSIRGLLVSYGSLTAGHVTARRTGPPALSETCSTYSVSLTQTAIMCSVRGAGGAAREQCPERDGKNERRARALT